MTHLLQIIERFFGKYYFKTKINILILFLCVPVLISSFIFAKSTLDTLAVMNGEIQGARYLVNFYKTFHALYSVAHLEAGMNTEIIQNLRDDINATMAAQAEFPLLNRSFQAVDLKEALRVVDTKENPDTMKKITSQWTDHVHDILNDSGLILDPSADSYRMMAFVNIDFMDFLFHYNTFLVRMNHYILDKKDDAEKIYLLADIDYLLNFFLDNIRYDEIESANPDLFHKYLQSTKTITDVVKNQLINIKDALIKGDPLINPVQDTRLINDLYAAQDSGAALLEELLNMQKDAAKKVFFFDLFLSLVFMILGIVVFIGFRTSVLASINKIVSLIRIVAQGNLWKKEESMTHDEIGEVIQEISSMQDGLRKMVNDVNEVIKTLSSSAREIASGNANLSERTQDQASSLVETAASLNNLTQTVKTNADHATHANELSKTASIIAGKGGEAVNKVNATMSEINDSAKKIQEITGVIDGIAFQTNLLALNASVEAARAGEQGRGFAVVAAEVRGLAQRSAEAAKEIKVLLNNSMSKVEEGDKQAKQTFLTMQDVLKSIADVTNIIENIAHASTEQSSGIQEINIVVASMEETTQKNAALVEEAAASAELLEEQARKLIDNMNRFDIQDRSTSKGGSLEDKAMPERPSYVLRQAAVSAPDPKDHESEWTEF